VNCVTRFLGGCRGSFHPPNINFLKLLLLIPSLLWHGFCILYLRDKHQHGAGFLSVNTSIRNIAIAAVLALPTAALATPIVIVELDGSTSPDILGGYTMTQFDQTAIPNPGCGNYNDGVYSVASPIDGQVDFETQGGDPLCMSVQDSDGLSWWTGDHGNVFTTDVPWVELIMPTNTRAFSLFVGANMTGRGWIEGIDEYDNTTRTYFGGNTGIAFGAGQTPGFGVYTPGSCTTITRIIIEPFEWGTGNFAINQDPCTTVPEPSSIWLFAIGLLGLGLSRRYRSGRLAKR
jgi:hypothetical protein